MKSSSNSEFTSRLPARELSTLLKVSGALTASLDLNHVLQTAIESTTDVLGLDTGAVYLLEEQALYLGATTPPLDPQFPEEFRQARLDDHPHITKAVLTGQPVYLHDATKPGLSPAEKAISEARHLRSVLFIPLVLAEQAIGVIIVGSTGRIRPFTQHEIELCRTLSFQIALAVANARLFKSVQQANAELTNAYDATLEGWSLALELRDSNTQGHTRRVTEMTVGLARKMGVSKLGLEHVRRGALLHDIGKMGIPDAILHNPGTLSEAETAVMQKHPELAYNFLLHIDFLRPALDIPLYHHEKWDGTGYPRGLKGQEIPLTARIFAVIDVFDALTSDRAYRRAWPKGKVLDYIRQQSGKHFDPDVVDAFLEDMDHE